ncbi:MAG: class I SAM-dependent methyltransferase [Promethearchaeota archaeon]
MPDWEDIFSEKGRVFIEPHPDMDKLSKIFKEKNIHKILDIGFGTGRHIVFFSKQGFKMYGFDASTKGLELTNKWLAEEGLSAQLVLHKMELKFPYPNTFFDAIISIQVIHHNKMKDILITVSEIERVLKKGGYIFITFPKLENNANFDEWKLKEIEDGTFVPQDGQEKGLPHHFFTIDEIYDVFSSFNLLEIYNDGTNHRAILGVKK